MDEKPMKRKIIQLANSTLVVSLPHAWVTAQGVKKGDEVEVDVSGASLFVTPGKVVRRPKDAVCKIKLEDPRYVRSFLGALYRMGYDTIHISYDSPKLAKMVQGAVTHLIGFEIMEQGAGYAVIRNVISETDQDFTQVLSKIVNIAKTMHGMLVEDLRKGKLDRLEEIEQFRHTSWKFRDFAHRILLQTAPQDPGTAPQFLIIWLLEKITRNYQHIYEDASNSPPKALLPALPMLKDLGEYFDGVVACLSAKNVYGWEAIYTKRETIQQKARLLQRQVVNAPFLSGLSTLAQQIHDIGSSALMNVIPKIIEEKVF